MLNLSSLDLEEIASALADQTAYESRAETGAGYQGKGAFRRFKAELQEEYPHRLPAWYAFRDARACRRAAEWLADNSLVDHAVVTRMALSCVP